MAGKVEGTVTAIDEQGGAVTSITGSQLSAAPRDESLRISCDGHITCGLFAHDVEHPEMTFLAVLNAQDQLELRLVGEDISRFLGIKAGKSVTVEW